MGQSDHYRRGQQGYRGDERVDADHDGEGNGDRCQVSSQPDRVPQGLHNLTDIIAKAIDDLTRTVLGLGSKPLEIAPDDVLA